MAGKRSAMRSRSDCSTARSVSVTGLESDFATGRRGPAAAVRTICRATSAISLAKLEKAEAAGQAWAGTLLNVFCASTAGRMWRESRASIARTRRESIQATQR